MVTRSIQHDQLISLLKDVKKSAKQSPASFLASLMDGYDSRGGTSELYDIVHPIDEAARQPSEEEWTAICDIIMDSDVYKRPAVPVELSKAAADTLMTYMYSKMKAIEISGDVSGSLELEPLSKELMATFLKEFDADH